MNFSRLASYFQGWCVNWPLPKRVGTWIGVSNAKALVIVWRDGTSKNSKGKMPHHYNCGCLCSQVHGNFTAAPFFLACWLIDWILSLQTIPSAIAVVIWTQLPARFGNGQKYVPIFTLSCDVVRSCSRPLVALQTYRPLSVDCKRWIVRLPLLLVSWTRGSAPEHAFSHEILGKGLPVAWHCNVTWRGMGAGQDRENWWPSGVGWDWDGRRGDSTAWERTGPLWV